MMKLRIEIDLTNGERITLDAVDAVLILLLAATLGAGAVLSLIVLVGR